MQRKGKQDRRGRLAPLLVASLVVLLTVVPRMPALAADRPALTASQEEEPRPQEREPEGIPLDWLFVGWAISALIGAVGGRIYVAIRYR